MIKAIHFEALQEQISSRRDEENYSRSEPFRRLWQARIDGEAVREKEVFHVIKNNF